MSGLTAGRLTVGTDRERPPDFPMIGLTVDRAVGAPPPPPGCDIDGDETLRDWAMRLADERVASIIEPHELAHARHRRDDLLLVLAGAPEQAAEHGPEGNEGYCWCGRFRCSEMDRAVGAPPPPTPEWNESNPEWWKAQIEGVREGDTMYEWLANEWERASEQAAPPLDVPTAWELGVPEAESLPRPPDGKCVCGQRRDAGCHDTVAECDATRGPCLDPASHHPFRASTEATPPTVMLVETHGESDDVVAEWPLSGRVVVTQDKVQIDGATVALYDDRHYYRTRDPQNPDPDDLDEQAANEVWIEWASTEATPPEDVVDRIRRRAHCMERSITDGDMTARYIEADDLAAILDAEAGQASTEATEQPDLRAALVNLVDAVTALENRAIRSAGEFHVWAEERMVTEARDEARAALTGSPSEPSREDRT